jgi:hypothetical protein
LVTCASPFVKRDWRLRILEALFVRDLGVNSAIVVQHARDERCDDPAICSGGLDGVAELAASVEVSGVFEMPSVR